MSKERCPRSSFRTGAHQYEPVNDGKFTRDHYLGSLAARNWACRDCGKTIQYDGRYAVAPRAR